MLEEGAHECYHLNFWNVFRLSGPHLGLEGALQITRKAAAVMVAVRGGTGGRHTETLVLVPGMEEMLMRGRRSCLPPSTQK